MCKNHSTGYSLDWYIFRSVGISQVRAGKFQVLLINFSYPYVSCSQAHCFLISICSHVNEPHSLTCSCTRRRSKTWPSTTRAESSSGENLMRLWRFVSLTANRWYSAVACLASFSMSSLILSLILSGVFSTPFLFTLLCAHTLSDTSTLKLPLRYLCYRRR